MNQAIRHTWVVAAALLVLILGSLTYVQFFEAGRLQANPWNSRNLLQQFSSDRGPILVDGQQIAYSRRSNDQYDYQRVYRDAQLYAPLTGFYSLLNMTGLEQELNPLLTGSSDQLFYDRITQILSGNQPRGASVELTIDPQLQKIAYDALGDQKGAIVALNPKTGEILAMVSKPSYDPNAIATHDTKKAKQAYESLAQNEANPLFNRAIGGNLYSPGSVFKIIDTAAALDSGKYNADSVLENPAELDLPGTNATLPNYRYGGCSARTRVDFSFALEQSCNTPFASIALDLGKDAIANEAKKFGFGEQLGIPLSVTPSIFPEELNSAQLAQSSVGQFDVRATPLQIAMMSAAIANNGVQMKPNLIKAVRAPDLTPISTFKPEQLRTPTSAQTANQIKDWMVNVVDKGIASGAAVPGVKVAGKTGTAELSAQGLNNAWFTGFAPADDPKIAVAIVVENVDVATGVSLTSPTAKKLFEAVLNK
ncbi:penicillin-binding protein 2 [Tersicoccus sp. Bi-70]|uniref:peptidoglycan D,D-transpeptidase FtsI family protein n=1 Tax=Tersicoccus sp. Bi-70 TaxID=1897634 RepID=UPI000977B003|nr:penicillin-binding transpeptidase domain-containing protein [Tersicoccus sp. Bi-70]OMH34150.1 peptidoglycan glycosyltransferase [Tersicoccus sp. Bi-70]